MRGRQLSDEQIERIKAVYAETGNISQAAREAGVSKSTAAKYIVQTDHLEQVRTQKRTEAIAAVARERADFGELLAEARERYVRHLLEDEVVLQTTAKDAATIVGILTDKHQLVTGGATQRTEASVYAALDTSISAPSDPEAAALARAYAARITHGARDASDVCGGGEP